ncbi:MAG: SAM-dependent methyltransferase [Streptosporangiaceae bacterium]|nr:SAM-dependent methyltransferase [Streptosporangiaceae bacterium]
MHEITQAINPDARVVYLDNDPTVAAHSQALKTGPRTAVLEVDLGEPQKIISHSTVREFPDFTQPLAMLLVAVLHFLGDEDASDYRHCPRRCPARQDPSQETRQALGPGWRRAPACHRGSARQLRRRSRIPAPAGG